jgi:hypothetical protein
MMTRRLRFTEKETNKVFEFVTLCLLLLLDCCYCLEYLLLTPN